MQALANRLRKNHKHWKRFAKTHELTAYRVYDLDMPEWPLSVDWYDGYAHVMAYPRRRVLKRGQVDTLERDAATAVAQGLEVASDRVFVKTHQPMAWGQRQYTRQSERGVWHTVREQGLSFRVNLSDFLDTGLFLDHRLTRQRVREEAGGKRFLNLFAYTGSFTVYAAAGGALETTTVDLSNRYLDWARENLKLNGLSLAGNTLLCADVLQWLDKARGAPARFDLIVLDPPSFSTSARMQRSFDVQKDHVPLLEDVAALLSPGGALYFSTNFRGFALDERRLGALAFEALTPRSLPPDFRQRDVHRCWRVTRA